MDCRCVLVLVDRPDSANYPIGECGILRVMEPLAFLEEREVHVLEASAEYLTIRLDKAIASGLSVVILLSRSALVGIIVSCKRQTIGYSVKVALTMSNPFDPLRKPQQTAPGKGTALPHEAER